MAISSIYISHGEKVLKLDIFYTINRAGHSFIQYLTFSPASYSNIL